MTSEIPPPLQFVHNIFSSINAGLQPPQPQQQPQQQQEEVEQVSQQQEEEKEEEQQQVKQQEEEQEEVVQQREKELKYLEFVQFATVQALMRFAILYSCAKDRSGPLKSGVETVEGAVKTVVAPVYNQFHLIPAEFLRYVDHKVDESVAEIDRHVPTNVKKVSSQARSVVSEVRRAGVVDAASGLAKTMYNKYEPKAEQCAVSAWQRLNQLPLFSQVAGAMLPKATYCATKYNKAVALSAEKGYSVSAYLPLVPTEKIAKVFSAVN